MKLINSSQQFNQIIDSQHPVVIKFFADWCPDCKRLDIFLPSVLEELTQIEFFEIDKDKFPDIAESLDVMGIPSLLVFQNGEKLGHLHSANAKTPEQVTEFLSIYVSKK
ncbi:thioredoxin family protein [Fictibacillus nanhaiensis]|uniref:thioredoxin family protein n=1 Tax=Fictibacillus nanhaiensis TaxID=742169 RepID=UPI001C96E261|nr:thioredoxin family protein [Fictibacillus nanhaiensis]MBY6035792.1 thioredoxin family protein [Fictibacillus nanhaiensis]